MPVRGTYLDMPLTIDDLDGENLEYFRHCAEHDHPVILAHSRSGSQSQDGWASGRPPADPAALRDV